MNSAADNYYDWINSVIDRENPVTHQCCIEFAESTLVFRKLFFPEVEYYGGLKR